MFEKVSPMHPDKIADRIAGAIVDLAYDVKNNPKVAVEVLIGHGLCTVIIETDTDIKEPMVKGVVYRIVGRIETKVIIVAQDSKLSSNQSGGVRAGDNGIFRGVPLTREELYLSKVARDLFSRYPYDSKHILDGDKLTICQSNVDKDSLSRLFPEAIINPLGNWTGGFGVDTGATNRKLGSDMATSVTGGGLHGKDLSKADVSINIYLFLKAQRTQETHEVTCSIGDTHVDGRPYSEIVRIAKDYIDMCGGFESFAEWGLV